MLLFSAVRKLFDRRCKGVGEFTLNPIVDRTWDSEVSHYETPCPKCGRAQPCDGRGQMLEHNR